MSEIEKIEKEIAELEKKLAKDHFGAIVDQTSRRREENRLKKLRRELSKLQMEKKK